jgi:serine/threonine-protein kinase
MAGVDPELMKKALGVPVELLQICMRAAAKEPADRYGSALEMRDALRSYIRQNKLEFTGEQMRALMDELYAGERAEIRRLVDQRMKQATAEDDHPGDPLRAIPVAPAVLGGLGAVTLTGNASSFVPVTPSASKGKWVAALVGVAVLAGVTGRLLSSSGHAVEGSTVASASASPNPTTAQQPRAADSLPHGKLVTVKIAASPSDTEILLDGAKLDGNPFVGQFPKDPALHRLELRSFGRRTEARMINLDQDLDLLIALEPDTSHAVRGGAPAVAPAGTLKPSAGAVKRAGETTPTEPAGTLSHKTKATSARPIDDADPYAN